MHKAIEQLSQNRFVIHGDLIFETVGAIYEQNKLLFEASENAIEISLSGVERADSSGLALIIEWLRTARQLQRPLKFTDVPPQILDLAKLSSLDELFKEEV